MSTDQRSIPIIAVFGSDIKATLEMAQSIGSEIALKRCVLLTGGTGANQDAVKDRAIAGAKKASDKGIFAPWVGVSRDKKMRDSVHNEDDKSIILHPGFNHKRNYIEACLCDAAIVLEGGEGTRSEATFCLALQKPIVFVGSSWERNYPLSGSRKEKTLNELVKESLNCVRKGEPGDSPFDRSLTEEEIGKSLKESLAAYKYFDLPADQKRLDPVAKQIVECAYNLSREAGLKGEFPSLEIYGKIKADYEAWLTKIEEEFKTQ